MTTTKQIARKKYTCNACEWLTESLNETVRYCGLTYAELREIVKARRNSWSIVPGQEYIKEMQNYDGYLYTWRAIPAIHALCLKYDLYEWV